MFCGMMFVSKLLIAIGSVAASGIVAIEAHGYRGPQNRGVAQFPLHYVLHGVTVTSSPILLSNATDAPSLAALCSATPTCKGFTVGSGGGEPGDLPPHDCRGSALYSADAITQHSTPHPGIDLFVFGTQPGRDISTVTPKPQAQIFDSTNGIVAIQRGKLTISPAQGQPASEVLNDAIARFAGGDLFVGAATRSDRDATVARATISMVTVMVLDTTADLTADVNESYAVSISSASGIQIRADTVWGALHGLETLAQCVVRGSDSDGSLHYLDEQVISDEPAYKFRGLMIDTARHFLSVPTILTVLEGMSVEKLNVLHWHAADDQSFPLESVALPRLAAAGPYGPGLGYTTENNSLVIAYARSRGIRVILEIDTPGHSQVVQYAYPEVGLVTQCPGTTCWPPLDISKNATLSFVSELWHDFGSLFPDGNVFIGGDECHTQCWGANPDVSAWAAKKGLAIDGGGEGTAFGWWIDQIVDIVHGQMGKRPMMWSPLVWDPDAPPAKLVEANAVLNLWTGPIAELANNITLKRTNELVLSNGWYLPTGNSAYSVDPRSVCKNCTTDQKTRIIGGSEQEFDLLDGLSLRLRRQRCRLVGRGVPTPPMTAVYVPDASHASFALWRELQWCGGDSGVVPAPREPSAIVRRWADSAATAHRRWAAQRRRQFD